MNDTFQNEFAQLVNQAIANDPNKHAAGSSNAKPGSAVSKQGIILHTFLKFDTNFTRIIKNREVVKAWIYNDSQNIGMKFSKLVNTF